MQYWRLDTKKYLTLDKKVLVTFLADALASYRTCLLRDTQFKITNKIILIILKINRLLIFAHDDEPVCNIIEVIYKNGCFVMENTFSPYGVF